MFLSKNFVNRPMVLKNNWLLLDILLILIPLFTEEFKEGRDKPAQLCKAFPRYLRKVSCNLQPTVDV